LTLKIAISILVLITSFSAFASDEQQLAVCSPGKDSTDKRVYTLSTATLMIASFNDQKAGDFLVVKVSGSIIDSSTGKNYPVPAALSPSYFKLDSYQIDRSGNQILGIHPTKASSDDVCGNKMVGFVLQSGGDSMNICLAANNREFGSNFKATNGLLYGYVCR